MVDWIEVRKMKFKNRTCVSALPLDKNLLNKTSVITILLLHDTTEIFLQTKVFLSIFLPSDIVSLPLQFPCAVSFCSMTRNCGWKMSNKKQYVVYVIVMTKLVTMPKNTIFNPRAYLTGNRLLKINSCSGGQLQSSTEQIINENSIVYKHFSSTRGRGKCKGSISLLR